MSESKHTTGPWCVDRHGTGKEWLVIRRRSDGKEIACIREVHNQPDAKLIAAAPNLLQSLKRLVERLEKCGGDPWRELAEARSTIDLVEGKPHANY